MCGLGESITWPVVPSEVGTTGARSIQGYASYGAHGLVVCDLPGLEEFALGTILSRVDMVLSPVGPTAPEVFGAANLSALARPARWPVWFVANNLPPGRRRSENLLRELRP